MASSPQRVSGSGSKCPQCHHCQLHLGLCHHDLCRGLCHLTLIGRPNSLGMCIGDNNLSGPISSCGGDCNSLAGAAFNSRRILNGCGFLILSPIPGHVEIGHAGGVLGWEGWRLLLLMMMMLDGNKKVFHQGIGFSSSFASCGDLLVCWHG